jgi:rhodanese-related sulfurtransferase
MSGVVSAEALARMLDDGGEIAVLDVREHGEYGEEHLFFGVNVPYSRFELDLSQRVPNPRARIVLYDQAGGSIAARAAASAERLGYADVSWLQGGIEAWKQAGFAVFAGVNVPSKTFGEMVEETFGTPSLSAEELAELRDRGEPVVVLDGRPWEEYHGWTIPGGISCPNGELAYRLAELVPDERTPVVVNCAGRTRSIIGCETLRQYGVKNPVYALRNGTMGWRLAGMELEHGATRRAPARREPADLEARRRQALALAERAGVARLSAEQVRIWLGETDRTTYLLDVRDPREYRQRHMPGSVSAPGGQLIQATDHWVGVRRARLVLVDDTEVRAAVCAYWLAQRDYDVAILAAGEAAWWDARSEIPAIAPVEAAPRVSVAMLAAELTGSRQPLLLDCQQSMAYRRAHVPGAAWVIRPRLEAAVSGTSRTRPIRLLGADSGPEDLLAADLRALGFTDVAVLDGGIAAWQAAGQPVAATADDPPDEDCADYLFFVHDRHQGNLESARRYLAWEHGLVESLAAGERAHYRLARPRQP